MLAYVYNKQSGVVSSVRLPAGWYTGEVIEVGVWAGDRGDLTLLDIPGPGLYSRKPQGHSMGSQPDTTPCLNNTIQLSHMSISLQWHKKHSFSILHADYHDVICIFLFQKLSLVSSIFKP